MSEKCLSTRGGARVSGRGDVGRNIKDQLAQQFSNFCYLSDFHHICEISALLLTQYFPLIPLTFLLKQLQEGDLISLL